MDESLKEALVYLAISMNSAIFVNYCFSKIDEYAKKLGKRDFIHNLSQYSNLLKYYKEKDAEI